MEGAQDESQTAAAIEAEFDGQWGVWRSTSGIWWAARRHAITAAAQTAGCVPYLRGHSLTELHQRMKEQDELHQSALCLRSPSTGDERRASGHPQAHSAAHDLANLQDEFPGFGIWREDTGERVRYVARRISIAQGLHTVVALDLSELRAVLHAESVPWVGHGGTPSRRSPSPG
jgi:hypothetical protein